MVELGDGKRGLSVSPEVQRLTFLLELTQHLQQEAEVGAIAQFALNYLVSHTGAAFGDVKVVQRTADTVTAQPLVNHLAAEFVAHVGQPVAAEMTAVLAQGVAAGAGVCWEVIETGQPLFIADYAQHPQALPALRHPGIGQLGIFPIPASTGEILGVLTLELRDGPNRRPIPQQEMILAACQILGARLAQAQAQAALATQTQQLEQTVAELRRAQVQLVQTEKMAGLGQLVAGIAHEINNPVSFIQGNLPHTEEYVLDVLRILALYQDRYPDPDPALARAIAEADLDFIQEDLRRLLKSMKSGVNRIRDIVRSLRNFSRFDEAEIKTVDLHEGLESTLLVLASRLRAQRDRPAIAVEKAYGNLPLVACDPSALNQVFLNVLLNAVEALEHQCQADPELVPVIQVVTQAIAGDRVEIRITDNGPGMTPEIQTQIFNPFFTTKPVGEGTGMGLPISYQIITERHGGTLTCESQPGHGTTLIVQIPQAQLESATSTPTGIKA